MTPLSLAIVYRSVVGVVDPGTGRYERRESANVYRKRDAAIEVTQRRAAAIRRGPGILSPDHVREEPPLPLLVVAIPEGLVDGLGVAVPPGTLQVVQLGDVVRFETPPEPPALAAYCFDRHAADVLGEIVRGLGR